MVETEVGGMKLQVKARQVFANDHQKLGKGNEGFFPRVSRGSLALLTHQFQTSSHQNCEKINFCCFKSYTCSILL